MFLEYFLFPMTSVIFRKIENSFLQKEKNEKPANQPKFYIQLFSYNPATDTDRQTDDRTNIIHLILC